MTWLLSTGTSPASILIPQSLQLVQGPNLTNSTLSYSYPCTQLVYHTQHTRQVLLPASTSISSPCPSQKKLMPERDGSGTSTSTWGGTTTRGTRDIEQLGSGVGGGTEGSSQEAQDGRLGEKTGAEGGIANEMNGQATSSSSREDSIEVDSSVERHAINPLRLHLRSQPGRGNGVFTSTLISAGTLIEESPVLLISAEQWERGDMQKTIFGEYGFCWNGGGQAIGLGLGRLKDRTFLSQADTCSLAVQPLPSAKRQLHPPTSNFHDPLRRSSYHPTGRGTLHLLLRG
jgi:hypothetical protein